MDELKKRASAAIGNLPAMYEVADAVMRSEEASREQIEAATAVRRSIATVLTAHSEPRLQVAEQRFAKLIAKL